MSVFSDVTLPALKTLTGVTEEVAGCCPRLQGLAWIIFLHVIHALFCIADSCTNAWEFTQFELNSYFNDSELAEREFLTKLLVHWGGYVFCFSIIPGVSRAALTCVMARFLHKQSKKVGVMTQTDTDKQSVITDSKTMLYWMIGNSIAEFIFEILGMSTAKLVIAFKSELALQALMTTPSKISGGFTLLLAIIDYILLGRRSYISYQQGSGCCRGMEYGIGFTALFLFQSVGLGTSMYSFAISMGFVNVYTYDSKDFYINILIVGGLSLGACFVTAIFMGLYSCLCRAR